MLSRALQRPRPANSLEFTYTAALSKIGTAAPRSCATQCGRLVLQVVARQISTCMHGQGENADGVAVCLQQQLRSVRSPQNVGTARPAVRSSRRPREVVQRGRCHLGKGHQACGGRSRGIPIAFIAHERRPTDYAWSLHRCCCRPRNWYAAVGSTTLVNARLMAIIPRCSPTVHWHRWAALTVASAVSYDTI